MRSIDDFSDITLRDEPLAPYTWLKIGGPAQYVITPRSIEELGEVVRCCHEQQLPLHILGNGSNLLVRDEGVSGVVVRLVADPFTNVSVEDHVVRAGAGALLSSAISHSVRAGLAGLDILVGVPGTVGGAVAGNAGGRSGDAGAVVQSVQVLTVTGDLVTRTADDLEFSYRESNLRDVTILQATFELTPDDPHEITQRMRKLWIMKKATQPLTFQSAGCVFKNPRGLRAGLLIEQAGLKSTRVGNAEVSDRHANFIVAHEGATSSDVLRLVDLVRSKVSEQFAVDLALELQVW